MSEPFVRLPMPNGAVRTFQTAKNFEAWVGETTEFWTWLTEHQQAGPGCTTHAAAAIREFLVQCRQHLLNFNNGNPDVGEAIAAEALQFFPAGVPISPDDEMVASVKDRFTELGKNAVRIAVSAAIYMESNRVRAPNQNALSDIAHPYALQAIGFAAIARHGTKPGQLKSLRAAIERAADATDKVRATGDDHLASFEAEAEQLLMRHTSWAVKQARAVRDEADATVELLHTTKATFEELMRLKSPTDYWANKAEEHRAAARTYRLWLTGLSSGAVIVLAVVYGLGWLALDQFAQDNPKGSIAMTLYVAGFVGAVTAVVLWFIRIVVRLYMSQHHLAADGEERASMIRTYLALTEVGKIEESERGLVLASVFRPVPDGIVKDDGGPSFSPAGLLASLLDKK